MIRLFQIFQDNGIAFRRQLAGFAFFTEVELCELLMRALNDDLTLFQLGLEDRKRV